MVAAAPAGLTTHHHGEIQAVTLAGAILAEAPAVILAGLTLVQAAAVIPAGLTRMQAAATADGLTPVLTEEDTPTADTLTAAALIHGKLNIQAKNLSLLVVWAGFNIK